MYFSVKRLFEISMSSINLAKGSSKSDRINKSSSVILELKFLGCFPININES